MNLNKRWSREEVSSRFRDSNNALVKIASRFNSTKITDPECCHYCDAYVQHFERIRTEPMRILEIGVKEGDSLLIWKEYFPNSLIFGLEYNPIPLKGFSHERIHVFIGDQSDVAILEKVSEEAGPFDIIIDDASHVMEHQQISFNHLFQHSLKDNGIYVIEDLGCSYWSDWGGGLRKPTATIEFLKNFIDGINYRFHRGGRTQYVGIPDANEIQTTYFDEHITGLSFYKAMCFIQKGYNPRDVM